MTANGLWAMTYDERDAFVTRQCLVRGRRAAMTDEEFWADVEDLRGVGSIPLLLGGDVDPDLEDVGPDPRDPGYPDPCSECGEVGACGYDAEGRPMVHVQREDD